MGFVGYLLRVTIKDPDVKSIRLCIRQIKRIEAKKQTTYRVSKYLVLDIIYQRKWTVITVVNTAGLFKEIAWTQFPTYALIFQSVRHLKKWSSSWIVRVRSVQRRPPVVAHQAVHRQAEKTCFSANLVVIKIVHSSP